MLSILRHVSESTVNTLMYEGQDIRDSIPGKGTDFTCDQTGSGAHSPYYPTGTEGATDNSPPSSAEVQSSHSPPTPSWPPAKLSRGTTLRLPLYSREKDADNNATRNEQVQKCTFNQKGKLPLCLTYHSAMKTYEQCECKYTHY
jgi:hypothetical protein